MQPDLMQSAQAGVLPEVPDVTLCCSAQRCTTPFALKASGLISYVCRKQPNLPLQSCHVTQMPENQQQRCYPCGFRGSPLSILTQWSVNTDNWCGICRP